MNTILKKLRENKKITQLEFSQIMNVAPSTVGLWEQGRREPSYKSLNKIADFYGVTTDYLLGRSLDGSLKNSREETNLLQGFRNLTQDSQEALLSLLNVLQRKNLATA